MTLPRKPKLLIVAGVWPHVRGNREAANVVAHEIASHLAAEALFEVGYCVVGAEAQLPASAGLPELDALRGRGLRFFDPIAVGPMPSLKPGLLPKLATVLAGRPDRLLHGVDQHEGLSTVVSQWQPDAVLTIWSELGGNMVGQLPVVRFNYAGNPEYKVFGARAELERRLPSTGPLRSAYLHVLEPLVKAAHLQAMRRFDLVWDVAANDAREYKRHGVEAKYLQNMWPGAILDGWEARRDASEQVSPLRIVGNVGNISATGNSFGFITLAEQILPRLVDRLGQGNFEIDLFGGGMPHPSVAPLLEDSHIRLRGFVPDLDAEILAAPIFLVANNHHRFKVGHTRFLHAWSLGACVVAFADSAEAMPEIRHGENALLAGTPYEMVDLIVRAGADRDLRRRIGAGGVATLQSAFSPATVVERISSDIRAVMQLEHMP